MYWKGLYHFNWIIDYLLLQFTLKLFHTCGNTTMCWLKTFYTVYAIFHDGFKKIVLAPNWQHPSHINFMTLTGTIMTDCTDGRVLLLLVVQCRCNYLNSEFQLNSFYVKLLRLSMYIWLVLQPRLFKSVRIVLTSTVYNCIISLTNIWNPVSSTSDLHRSITSLSNVTR